jgi:hypothetical protein
MLPDKLAVLLQYRRAHGRFPRLNPPVTFTEKVQYRKLYDRDARLPVFADKAKAKALISGMIGPQYIIETLWAGRDTECVNFEELQRPFVIKPTHSCGETIFVREDDHPNWDEVRKRCRSWVDCTYGSRTREWLYKHIEPGIMIERMIGDGKAPPADFKLFVFHGETKVIQVDVQRFGDVRERAMYDADWKRLAVHSSFPDSRHDIDQPKRLDEMKRVAERIGSAFDFVRVDLYEVGERIFFGETTFYPASGYARYHPDTFDVELGELWKQATKTPQLKRSSIYPGKAGGFPAE